MGPLIGVDIGQKRDPTAICVAQVVLRGAIWHYLIHLLERLPLGTSYPEVANRIVEIIDRSERTAGERPRVFIDATGVGLPVVDLVQERFQSAVAVYFTSGNRRYESRGRVSLGKAWMVSRLQALIRGHRIHLPRVAEGRVLAAELHNFEMRVDQNAHDRYGAFRVGTHDDLVTALGLAVQCEP